MSQTSDSRVVMISGANRGIGAAVAARLAAEGWTLSLGVRNPSKLAGREDSRTLVQAFDASRGDEEARWVETTLARFGRIDAVVNNAGIMIPKTVLEATEDDIEALLQVNVKSPLRLVKAAYPALTRSGKGRVVTLVSLSGKRVKTAASGSYSMSKFAALALSHAIRHAGWDEGVRSTAICPGFVATDMAKDLVDLDPAGMTQPEDLAGIVSLVLNLPNTASVPEIAVNCALEANF
ncbi:MAG: SDR family NAD(P)-dependent oxidoreductase [Rhodospirillales bacterium]